MPLTLADEIEVQEKESGTELLSDEAVVFDGLSWPIPLCSNGDNLIMKAIELFRKKTGIKSGLKVKLKKNIPIGGGLGGGSADAATMLNALNSMWNTNLSKDALSKIGLEIGCDVPAMLYNSPMIMEGKGEKVSMLSCKENFSFWIVLVYPGFSISTADMYARWDKYGSKDSQSKKKYKMQIEGLEAGNFDLIGQGLYNAFECVAFKKYPVLEILKKELELAGANYVLLTGSGSVLFALAQTKAEAKRIGTALKKKINAPLYVAVEQVLSSF